MPTETQVMDILPVLSPIAGDAKPTNPLGHCDSFCRDGSNMLKYTTDVR